MAEKGEKSLIFFAHLGQVESFLGGIYLLSDQTCALPTAEEVFCAMGIGQLGNPLEDKRILRGRGIVFEAGVSILLQAGGGFAR